MDPGTPSLSTILDASVPVVGNRELLEAVATTRGRPILALVVGARVLDSACIPHLYDVLATLSGPAERGATPSEPAREGPSPVAARSFDVFLGPLGPAVAEVGRVAALLADHGRFEALVPIEASPAATLVAFAADRLWLGPAATLAPLLPTDAPDATARALLELLAAAPSDTRPAALARWWGEFEPRALGLAVRARHELAALAHRCLTAGGRPSDVARAIAHRFTAAEEPDLAAMPAECQALGLPVQAQDPGLYRALVALHRYYARMLEVEGEMTWRQHRYAVAYDAFIDTPTERRILLRITRADDHGRPLRDVPTVWRWVRPSGREIAIDQVMEL